MDLIDGTGLWSCTSYVTSSFVGAIATMTVERPASAADTARPEGNLSLEEVHAECQISRYTATITKRLP